MHPVRCCNCSRPTFSRVVLVSGTSQRPVCRLCDARLRSEGVIHFGELKNSRVRPEVVQTVRPKPRLDRWFFPLSRIAALLLLVSISLG